MNIVSRFVKNFLDSDCQNINANANARGSNAKIIRLLKKSNPLFVSTWKIIFSLLITKKFLNRRQPLRFIRNAIFISFLAVIE